METPFPAYRGDEPYAFVCYSHDDSAIVFPELQRLREGGLNVYYDEGISPGHEWTQELADAIDGCSRFLYFISPAAVASRHCRNEVQYALDQGKALVSIYLEPTELPGGLKLSLGSAQAILKYELSAEEYQRKLLHSFRVVLPSNAPLTGQQHVDGEAAEPRTKRLRLYRWLAAAGLSIAAVGFALWLQVESVSEDSRREGPAGAPSVPDRSIAMVPFSAAENDAAAATYARALIEEIRSVIARYPELRIIAVPEMVDPREIDEASYVLGGSVQHLSDSVRLRAHLTRTDDQHTVWANAFEHPMSNGTIDAAEMATTVGRFVRLQLFVDPHCESVRRTTPSQEAADAYCAALTETYRGAQIGGFDLRLALNSALRAVALDPEIAEAHYLAGYHYFQLGENGQMHWKQARQQARAALDRRLALAPHDAQSLGLQGRIEQLEMDYPAAELSFRESLASDPLDRNLNPIHMRLGSIAVARGHVAEGLEHYHRALRLDDSNAVVYSFLGRYLWFAGEYREAIDTVDAGLRLVSGGLIHANLLAVKIAAYDALGARSRANEILDEALATVEFGSRPWLARSLASLGRTDEAQQLLTTLEGLEQPPIQVIAETYAALEDERAFEWIHKAIDQHLVLMLTDLRASPVYSELSKDPRWADVISHLEAEESKGRALFNDPE